MSAIYVCPLELKERAWFPHQSTKTHFASMLLSYSTNSKISGTLGYHLSVHSKLGFWGQSPSSMLTLPIEITLGWQLHR